MIRRSCCFALTIIAVVIFPALAVAQASPPTTQPAPPAAPARQPTTAPAFEQPEPADPKWLDRIPKDDRAAIDEMLGYAPPAFTEDIKWIDSEPGDWGRLRGKVIVVQSWTTGSTSGRGWPARVAGVLQGFEPKDVRIIALHTPEKADNAEDFMKRQKPPEGVLIALDPIGTFCDAMGVYMHPVNFVIDRNGMVRYAGLNLNGLKQAVAELVQEPFDRAKAPPSREQPQSSPQSVPDSPYPSVSNSISGATDFRGKRAPEFTSESWITKSPNPAGKAVMITFWSIEDGASMAAQSHLNQLASRFGDRLCVIGLAGNSRSEFEDRMLTKNISKSDFQYAVAVDRTRKMANAMGVRTIPHAILMSKDWIVRWQGRPEQLKPEIIQQVIDADAATTTKPTTGPSKQRGWVQ